MSSQKARVLYVDDDVALLDAFRRVLRREACDVAVCADPLSALKLLEHGSYDVVVSDYQMPGMNGIAFLAEVSRLRPDIPRLLVTGHSDFETAVSAINQVSVYRFVSKPWQPRELRQTVLQAIEHGRLRRENTLLQGMLAAKNRELEAINLELEQRVHRRTRNVLDGLVLALDYRDTETQWHSRRVAEYASHLAGLMGLKGTDRRTVEWGSLLHDIGKIGIPDHILLKPAALTAEEWAVMRTHPQLGYNLLKDIDFLADAARIVAHHHERFDGSGYPTGIQGDDIVLGARIFAVIDTFDAMTSDRPYRLGLPYSVARAEIARVAASQLDPMVVDAWMTVPEDDWTEIRDAIGGGPESRSLLTPHGLSAVADLSV